MQKQNVTNFEICIIKKIISHNLYFVTQDCRVFLYADDVKLVKIIDNFGDCLILQKNIDTILRWLDSHLLTVNINKCRVMSFTRKVNVITHNYIIQGIPLIRCNEIRDLGVIIDSSLSFIPHINHICNRATQMLGFVVRSTRDFTNTDCIKTLYISLVRSILEYCSVVWTPFYDVHMCLA